MSRPFGSATADALHTARGSDPTLVTVSRVLVGGAVAVVAGVAVRVVVAGAEEPLLPQPAASSATAATVADALPTQPDPADDAASRPARHPARIDCPEIAASQPAGSGETRPADRRDVAAADVAARQILEL